MPNRNRLSYRAAARSGLVALALLLASSVALAQGPNVGTEGHGPHQGVENQRGREKSNNAPETSVPARFEKPQAVRKDSHPSEDASKHESWRIDWPTWITALSAVATVIFTGFLAVSTRFLWKETKRLAGVAEEQSKDIKASIDVAREQASAASLTAKNLLRASRPLCVMQEIQLGPFEGAVPKERPPDGYRWMCINGVIANKGNADAFGRDMRWAAIIGPEIGDPLVPDKESTVFGFDLLRAQANTDANPVAHQIHLPDQLEFGDDSLFVWGWIRYADLHGITRRSGFAFKYSDASPLLRAAGFEGFFEKYGGRPYWYDLEEKPDA